ncbi:MAG TPA: NADH-quinone oxidoreductase subunit L [Bryobacteraceae bacterium]|nr:NADH-quinone oxidoreductase subunit L [Bryobacteraceae bacterium]
MLELLWLVPAIPFGGALVLATLGPRLSRKVVAAVGIGTIAAAAAISLLIASAFLSNPPAGSAFTQTLWTWIGVRDFRPAIAFYLDPLSLIMLVVVTFVAFLIHVYSAEFMAGDEGYSRFFAYMNLFVASMVVLVLADNLLLLYLGWEGVGLCSYLLIGFWYQDPANGRAAQKAFIVTRVGDTSMSIGLLLLFWNLGTLQIQDVMSRASAQWATGSGLAIAAAALLLGGAVGKSAQLPLQTWLPDAMAGPTPTSALIHAATMVTAGVYLIARTHVLFQLAPPVQFAVAVVGAATLLLAGFSALAQRDIKRVLAYSTISQIGYMFLALGAGAWAAAMFHFMTHAFFKALLFLSAGIVIEALHHEHDIFRMGGLRKALPVAFWTFLAGGAALAGLPLVTAGAYSKDLILWDVFSSPIGGPGLWVAGIAGVVLTSLYTFRLIFLVFFGTQKTDVSRRPGFAMQAPVWILAVLSIVAGFVQRPFIGFADTVLPRTPEGPHGAFTEATSSLFAALAFAAGLLLAWMFYRRKPVRAEAAAFGNPVQRFWLAGWGFDWLYDRLFVRPVIWLARINKGDVVDTFYDGLAWMSQLAYRGLSLTQTGNLRWYAAGLAVGSVLFVAIVMFL